MRCSPTHGAHHGAQKLTTTMFPGEAMPIFSAVSISNSASLGTGLPTSAELVIEAPLCSALTAAQANPAITSTPTTAKAILAGRFTPPLHGAFGQLRRTVRLK